MMKFSWPFFKSLVVFGMLGMILAFVLRAVAGCSSPPAISPEQVRTAVEARRELCARTDLLPAGEHRARLETFCRAEAALDPMRCEIWPAFCPADGGS